MFPNPTEFGVSQPPYYLFWGHLPPVHVRRPLREPFPQPAVRGWCVEVDVVGCQGWGRDACRGEVYYRWDSFVTGPAI